MFDAPTLIGYSIVALAFIAPIVGRLFVYIDTLKAEIIRLQHLVWEFEPLDHRSSGLRAVANNLSHLLTQFKTLGERLADEERDSGFIGVALEYFDVPMWPPVAPTLPRNVKPYPWPTEPLAPVIRRARARRDLKGGESVLTHYEYLEFELRYGSRYGVCRDLQSGEFVFNEDLDFE